MQLWAGPSTSTEYSVPSPARGAPFEKTWKTPHPQVSGGVEPEAGALGAARHLRLVRSGLARHNDLATPSCRVTPSSGPSLEFRKEAPWWPLKVYAFQTGDMAFQAGK